MTTKAKAVLQKLSQRQALKRLNTPDRREKVLKDFNASTLDDVGPIGGDQSMAVLKDMNDLEVGHDEFIRSLVPNVEAL